MQQARQMRQRGPVGQPSLDRVETRPLKASDQFGVARHGSMVPVGTASTEVNAPYFQGSTTVNRSVGPMTADLREAVIDALALCRLSDKDAANAMGIDPGRWSRQKAGVDGHFIQLDRLALLPESFHREFARLYAERVGYRVSHQTIARLLLARVGQLLTLCGELAEQLEQAS
jgi:hypothetical protein